MSGAAGIVLCGGKSSRMGRPKAWLPFGGEALLQRVVRILSECLDPIVAVAAPNQEVPGLPPGIFVVRDDQEYLGPLNGLATGLQALAVRTDVAYLSSCDVPFLRPAFVRRVVEALGDADVCVPDVRGYRHPLAAAYRTSVLPTVQGLISAGRLRPAHLFDAVPTRFLNESELTDVDPGLASLRNVNTPDEYAAALRDAGYAPDGPV